MTPDVRWKKKNGREIPELFDYNLYLNGESPKRRFLPRVDLWGFLLFLLIILSAVCIHFHATPDETGGAVLFTIVYGLVYGVYKAVHFNG